MASRLSQSTCHHKVPARKHVGHSGAAGLGLGLGAPWSYVGAAPVWLNVGRCAPYLRCVRCAGLGDYRIVT